MASETSVRAGWPPEKEFRFPQGILATCCLPWNKDFSLDENTFRESLKSIAEWTKMIYLFGTAGEGYALSREQFSGIVSVFTDEMRKNKADAMVGIISLSLAEMKKRIDIALGMGVRLFQISLPSWDVLDARETELFFDEILGSYPQADFLHYNLMRAGRVMTPLEYAELARRHKNFVGAKITTDSTRYIEELMGLKLPVRFFFTNPGYAYASRFGPCGFLIALASCNWQRARTYYEAGRTGDRDTLLSLQAELREISRKLLSLVRGHGHIDGAYDKMFLKLHHPDFSLRLLPPYAYPPDSVFREFREFLVRDFPQWLPN